MYVSGTSLLVVDATAVGPAMAENEAFHPLVPNGANDDRMLLLDAICDNDRVRK